MEHRMGSATQFGAPMSRDGSGTSWVSDASPLEAVHHVAGGWSLMVHGAIYPRYTAQDAFGSGTRGDASFGAPNWAMGMAQRQLDSDTRLTLRLMASLDDAVEGGRGYPLLFQTGETFEGERLVDRQHPHDLVSELSATFTRAVSEDVGVFLYAAYPGEPALGPTAFMHRPSARFSPDAPLSHHWQDATHIVWGVATGGLTVGPAKLEGSVFTGREPDEDRVAPDPARFESFSGRLAIRASRSLSLQVSMASLDEPEALEPGIDQTRMTASALYTAPLGHGNVSAALIWGRNVPRGTRSDIDPGHGHDPVDGDEAVGGHGATNAFLAESALQLGQTFVFGRAEWVEKAGEELALDGALSEGVHRVGALSVGAGHELVQTSGLALSVGGQVGTYRVPDSLRPLYGDTPVSLQAFVRLTPLGR